MEPVGSIEVRVLCMLCHKMIDEHISDINKNVSMLTSILLFKLPIHFYIII